MVADAAKYLPPGRPAVRRALAPVARLGMAVMAPEPDSSRAPCSRPAASRPPGPGPHRRPRRRPQRWRSRGPFLNRLLLHTDEEDLRRIEEIRRWFKPDVEYACDLALVPMMARLEDVGVPLVAAAQGFEIVQRRGVGVQDALQDARHRLDLVLSGSQANIDENLSQIPSSPGATCRPAPSPTGWPWTGAGTCPAQPPWSGCGTWSDT